MFTGRTLSPQRRRWVWLLICLCIGQSLLPEMVPCVGQDGHLMVEPAVEGKCSDLVRVVPAEESAGVWVSTPTYCDLCQDLPLASGAAYRLPRPAPTQIPLLAVPAMVVHPVLQPLALAAIRTSAFVPPPAACVAALTALRTTTLLI